MGKVIWTDPALESLRDIIEYIAKDSPSYAERFGIQIVESPRRLEKYPHSGRIVPEFNDEEIRELFYSSYRIIYLIKDEDCYITAVIHGSRDIIQHLEPGDWDIDW